MLGMDMGEAVGMEGACIDGMVGADMAGMDMAGTGMVGICGAVGRPIMDAGMAAVRAGPLRSSTKVPAACLLGICTLLMLSAGRLPEAAFSLEEKPQQSSSTTIQSSRSSREMPRGRSMSCGGAGWGGIGWGGMGWGGMWWGE